MRVDVRRIGPGEGETLKSIRLRALADAPYAFSATLAEAQQKSDARWAAEARHWSVDPMSATFFAETEDGVVGMAGVHIAGQVSELVAVWTAPEARRRQIAQQIIETIAEWSRDAGATELWTAVADGNERARSVYESAGFVATGMARPIGADSSITEWRFKRELVADQIEPTCRVRRQNCPTGFVELAICSA